MCISTIKRHNQNGRYSFRQDVESLIYKELLKSMRNMLKRENRYQKGKSKLWKKKFKTN